MKRLSDLERRVLEAAQWDADSPLNATAHSCGVQVHRVRHALQGLQERNAIVRYVYVNAARLGMLEYSVYFSLNDPSSSKRSEVRLALKSMKRVSHALELGGEFHFFATFAVHSVAELESLLGELTTRVGKIFREKYIHVRQGWYHFGAQYLGFGSKRIVEISGLGVTETLDETDHKILHSFVRSKDGNIHTIATALKIPQATVSYRLEKLKTRGVIALVLWYVRPMAFGYLTYRVLVSSPAPNARLRERIRDWASEQSAIVSVTFGVGRWDYELRIESANDSVVHELAQELPQRFTGDISRVDVIPVFEVLTLNTYPFDFDDGADQIKRPSAALKGRTKRLPK